MNTVAEKLARLFVRQQQHNAGLRSNNNYLLTSAKTPAEVFSTPEYQSHLLKMLNGEDQNAE